MQHEDIEEEVVAHSMIELPPAYKDRNITMPVVHWNVADDPKNTHSSMGLAENGRNDAVETIGSTQCSGGCATILYRDDTATCAGSD